MSTLFREAPKQLMVEFLHEFIMFVKWSLNHVVDSQYLCGCIFWSIAPYRTCVAFSTSSRGKGSTGRPSSSSTKQVGVLGDHWTPR